MMERPKFTRKHYGMIAQAIGRTNTNRAAIIDVAESVAEMLAMDNSNFNQERFVSEVISHVKPSG